MSSDHKQNLESPEEVSPPTTKEKPMLTDVYLCMTGVQTHMIEKDVMKWIRKNLGDGATEMPVKGVMKKRGTNFAFLQFTNKE